MWQTWDGRLVPVGCGRNTCPRCAWLKAAENVQVVKLDAQERMPTFGITLTTADPDFPARRFRTAMSQYFRWLRREFPVEYLGLIEWSTGRALTAKGHRYQHQHTLVKGIPTGTDTDPLWRESKRRWEHLTGAYRVEFRELRTPAGAISYMVAHHHKAEQATPEGRSSTGFARVAATLIGRLRTFARRHARCALVPSRSWSWSPTTATRWTKWSPARSKTSSTDG
jgi:hypothetical protein